MTILALNKLNEFQEIGVSQVPAAINESYFYPLPVLDEF